MTVGYRSWRAFVVLIFGLIAVLAVSAAAHATENTQAMVDGLAGTKLNTANGNLYLKRADLGFAGDHLPININLSYNSRRSTTDTGFGYGWQLNYNIFYSVDTSGNVTVIRSDGRRDRFNNLGGGNFDAPAGVFDTLSVSGSGYLLTTKRRTKYYMDAAAHTKLTKVVDSKDNSMTLTYNGSNQLIKITDPVGRAADLTWSAGHVTSIKDPTTSPNREVKYTYTGNNLTKAERLLQAGVWATSNYSYNAANQMGGVVTPEGETLEIAYAAVSGVAGPIYRTRSTSESMAVVVLWNNAAKTANVHGYKVTTSVSRAYVGEQYSTNGENFIRSKNLDGASATWSAENKVTQYVDENSGLYAYTYDTTGNITKIVEPGGNSTVYTYDANNNLETQTDQLGRATAHDHDSESNLTKLIDPAGKSTTYTYDGAGNRLTEKDKNGNSTTYTYDSLDQPTKITDPIGNSTVYTYDSAGNQTGETDKNGNTTTYQYDVDNRLTKVTDPQGNSSVYTYDAYGRVESETDKRGNTTNYTYDYEDQGPSKITDSLGNSTTYQYDQWSNKVGETDKNGNSTTYTYDSDNRLTKATDPQGNSTTYTYDGVGNKTQEKDKNGNTTTYTYDSDNRLTKATDPQNNSETYNYDAKGNRIGVTDKRGNVTTYTYDNLDRQTKAIDPGGNSETYNYDAKGNRIGVTDKRGNVTTYTYDNLDRPAKVTDPQGNSETYTYDKNGNRVVVADKRGNVTTYTYDSIDRQTKATDPQGNSETYVYDAKGNIIGITSKGGNVTTYTYDSLDRQTKATDPGGNSETYTYDAKGKKKTETDKTGNVTIYTYDSLDRQTKVTDPQGKSSTFDYDANGNRTQRNDAQGNQTTYQYDSLDRLTLRDFPGTTDDTFTYDAGGLMISANNTNRATGYTYDSLNRLTNSTQAGKNVAYGYNIPAQQSSLVYPGGKNLTNTFTSTGRLQKVEDTTLVVNNTFVNDRLSQSDRGNGLVSTYTYDALNRVTQLLHKQGVTTTSGFSYGFDANSNRTYKKREHDLSNSEKYTYDSRDRLTDYKRGTLNGSFDIPTPNTQTDFNLDASSNWLNKTTDSQVETRTPNSLNQYTSIFSPSETTLTYDADGNLTNDASNTYEYDYENRLTKVTRKSDSVTLGQYKYDALGRRAEKTADGTTTTFIYDGDRIIEEQRNATTTASFTYGEGIDEVLTMTRDTTTYYYHADSLGNIDTVTDSSGTIREAYRYGPYGQPQILTGAGADSTWFTADDSSSTTSSIGNPFMFTGREYDSESGLYHYRARAYHPRLGRFMQRDPIGPEDSLNLYEYVGSSPGNLVDPMGKDLSDQEISQLNLLQLQLLKKSKANVFIGIGGIRAKSKDIPGIPGVPAIPKKVGAVTSASNDSQVTLLGEALSKLLDEPIFWGKSGWSAPSSVYDAGPPWRSLRPSEPTVKGEVKAPVLGPATWQQIQYTPSSPRNADQTSGIEWGPKTFKLAEDFFDLPKAGQEFLGLRFYLNFGRPKTTSAFAGRLF